ncbi:hypothetical protein [Streptomyces sp. NPDC017988]|uniref:hypothetical protein n=1 Tax=Streptomyces sp. NPDC017988 TaxID=3365025 RepID=UPI00378B9349
MTQQNRASCAGVSERGWRGRLVPVPRPAGEPAFLTLRSGGPFSYFSATGAIETRDLSARDASIGISTFGSEPHPFILPAEYTHVLVTRPGASGVARWYLRTLPEEEIGVLALSGETRGTGPTLLRWAGPCRTFAFTLEGNENWTHLVCMDTGGRPMPAKQEGGLRRRITLPVPGFVMVRSAGPWVLQPT